MLLLRLCRQRAGQGRNEDDDAHEQQPMTMMIPLSIY